MYKKAISLMLAVVMLASLLAGCGGSASSAGGSQAAPAADTAVLYHCYNTAPYVTLDPSSEVSNGIMILQNVYETLTHYNSETEKTEPMLATSWTSSEDGLTWVFQLRDDVTFHDGAKMTAADVVASINRTVSIGQGAAYIWDSLDKVEATGDYEVTFTLTYPAPIDLIACASYAAYIIAPSCIDKDVEWFNEGHDGGTGPYMITKATGDSVVLTAYEDYRDGWQDNQYKNVLVKEVSESSARRQLIETGEAQIAADLSSTDLAALRDRSDILHTVQVETFNNILMFLNSQKAPCDNADFRRALQYAFPYEETVNGVMDGNAKQCQGLIPAGLWGHSEEVLQYTCDLDKAKEYFEKSGVAAADAKVTVSYMTGTDEYASSLQLFQSNLKKIGITLELRSMEWDEQWADAQATNPDDRQDLFVMIWWPDYPSPNSWFDALIHSEDSITYNLAYIKDDDIDALIEEADLLATTDREEASKRYIQIQQMVMERGYIVAMYDQNRTYLVRNEITGVSENPAYSTAVPYYKVTKNG